MHELSHHHQAPTLNDRVARVVLESVLSTPQSRISMRDSPKRTEIGFAFCFEGHFFNFFYRINSSKVRIRISHFLHCAFICSLYNQELCWTSVFRAFISVARFKIKMARFSYRKFTEIQVQGARERAFRQVEVSQLASRLDHVEEKYKEILQTPKEKDMTIHHSAVVKAFSNEKDREVSLFMTSRFAQICRQEYHTIMADKTLIRLRNDNRVVINWLFQQVQEAEKERGQMELELARKVEETRRELREFQQRKLQELQANLEWKKAELRALRDRKMKEIEDRKEQELIRARELVEKQEWQDRSEWVDIEDDFLMGSEWVVCS
jgi:hypothetical protein